MHKIKPLSDFSILNICLSAQEKENLYFFVHSPCAVFSAHVSHKGSFICREGGMEKKTFPFELTDLQ